MQQVYSPWLKSETRMLSLLWFSKWKRYTGVWFSEVAFSSSYSVSIKTDLRRKRPETVNAENGGKAMGIRNIPKEKVMQFKVQMKMNDEKSLMTQSFQALAVKIIVVFMGGKNCNWSPVKLKRVGYPDRNAKKIRQWSVWHERCRTFLTVLVSSPQGQPDVYHLQRREEGWG